MLRLILRLPVLLLACLLHLCVHAQEHTLLQYALSKPVSKADSSRIIASIRNSQQFEYQQLDTAIALVDRALAESRSLNFTYGIGTAYIAYSVYATTAGKYRESDSFLQKAYPYCVQTAAALSDNRLLVHWYDIASNRAAYTGEYNKSVSLACAALNLLNQRPNDTSLITARIRAYNAIGSMLQYLRQPKQAFYYLDKGIALAQAHNDKQNLAQLYVNYGSAYNVLKQWPEARACFAKAIPLAQEGNNTFVLQVAYLTEAGMYIDSKDYDNAITSLNRAMAQSDKTNPFMAKVTPKLLLGQVYLARKEYARSITYAASALAIAKQMHAIQNITDAHGLLADAYHATGQWEKAYTHQFTYTRLLDSIRNAATIANVNQLEVKSRIAEKDIELARRQLALNQKETALREKNFWIAGVLACLLLLSALLFSIRRNYRSRQKLQESAREVDQLKAMMDGAEQERKRIAAELHDGVVSQLWGLKLNLATSIDRQQDGDTGTEDLKQNLAYLDDAMNDLRATAHNLSPEMAVQAGLVNALAGFCNRMNNQGRTDVLFQVYGQPGPTHKQAALSIFRAVQELVQNALKHAAAGTILVQLNYGEDMLGITVQDDGRGFDTTAVQAGMGLRNVQERVSTLHASMDLQSSDQGTSVYMEFKNNDITDTRTADEHDH